MNSFIPPSTVIRRSYQTLLIWIVPIVTALVSVLVITLVFSADVPRFVERFPSAGMTVNQPPPLRVGCVPSTKTPLRKATFTTPPAVMQTPPDTPNWGAV